MTISYTCTNQLNENPREQPALATMSSTDSKGKSWTAGELPSRFVVSRLHPHDAASTERAAIDSVRFQRPVTPKGTTK